MKEEIPATPITTTTAPTEAPSSSPQSTDVNNAEKSASKDETDTGAAIQADPISNDNVEDEDEDEDEGPVVVRATAATVAPGMFGWLFGDGADPKKPNVMKESRYSGSDEL